MVDITLGYGRGKRCAIVDIGVGGVSLSIVQTEHNGSVTVLANGRSALTLETHTEKQAAGMIAAQIKEAGDLALQVYANHHQKAAIESVFAVIHAPWAHSATVRTSARFPHDTLIQAAMLSALAKEALGLAKDIDVSNMIEASMTRIEINGYVTRNPEGTHAQLVDAISLISDCDATVKDAASSALSALFPVAKITWRSGVRAIAAFVEDTDFKNKNFLIVDMSTDATHVISVKDGQYEQYIVPEGVRTILARVAAGRLPDETLGYMRMLAREACSNEACEAVQKAMALAEPELVRIFGEVIGKMAALRHVPNDLILITHPDLEAWLSGFFARIDFSQFTLTTLPFEVSTPTTLGIDTWIHGEHQEPALAADTALVNMETGF